MPRARRDYRAIHAAADKLEPELASRIRRGMTLLRARVSLSDVSGRLQMAQQRHAIGGGLNGPDVDAIVDLILPADGMAAALAPIGTAARDSVMQGGRLGAEIANKAIAARGR